ncbi:oxaloacetate decarboxylase [Porphyromonas levii]|uniref:Oxaloacetate decarboxylase n=1 Tax=Porphyromonas levii TaxID=28114 RepID=A0A4Y8WP26_9PORP|nr:oxaloacetate decarboxylase [Porphyromonas levii]TFH94130.1 oxaloacetate decarboxylase [Porphyromonas levii]TFH95836.1 oxaloacetate decarboxylase [Porphyromonas levii]
MKKKSIKFSLIYRDMFQSSGKYQPRVDQLERVAPAIVEMGCFARVETNGGAFEQVQLLYGENPNKAVRAFTKVFHEAGIQTHMLDRGLNALRMYPVPADVRRLMYKVKKAQGTDITRIFCGLNDVRNIIPSIHYAKEAGMIPQAALCITHSPIHTAEYYTNIAFQLIDAGAPEICLKDMAGIGRPTVLGKIVKAIKERNPEVIVQYHGHSGPGFSPASMLEVARAGVDILDVAVEPLAWGKIHPDVITIQQMLKADGFDVPEINMNAYMKVRSLTQEFLDDFLGYFTNFGNLQSSSLLVGCGLPGGMMGSMMADLKGIHSAINMYHKQNGEPEISVDDLMVKLFNEVEYVWPKLGYPPLVTPFSQYVKNVALMNVFNMERGEGRWQAIDKNTWGMITGKSGKLPGQLAPEIVALAKEQGEEFTDANPQDNYPDELDKFRKMMDEEGWDYGEDDEELFEFAMHEQQYRDLKSGVAKQRFEADLAKLKAEAQAKKGVTPDEIKALQRANYIPVTAPVSGQIFWEVDFEDRSAAPSVGTSYRAGSKMCFIQTNVLYTVDVLAGVSGRIREIVADQGANVRKGDVIAYMDECTDFLPEEEVKKEGVTRIEKTHYVGKATK